MFDYNDPRFVRASHGVLIVDNYDSFTYNLAHYVAEVTGVLPTVISNDDAEILADAYLHEQDHRGTPRAHSFYREFFGQYAAVIVSPGPGSPNDPKSLGLSAQAVSQGEVPVLGVCLGLQAQIHLYGGQVDRAVHVRHGRSSLIAHNGDGLFEGVPSPLSVVRYHSLQAFSVPECFDVIAETVDVEGPTPVVMAIKHTSFPHWGVQFHPESLCTQGGRRLIANFIHLASQWNLSIGRMHSLEVVPAARGRTEYESRVADHARTRLQQPAGWRTSNRDHVPPLRPASQYLSESSVDADVAFFRANVHYAAPQRTFALHARRTELPADPNALPRLFEREFLPLKAALWLDSSDIERASGRFSMLSGFGGPYSKLLSHRVGSRAADGAAASLDHCEIVDHKGMIEVAGEYKVFEVLSAELQATTCDESTLAGLKLPFDFRPGWVGGLGYELHAETGAGHPVVIKTVGSESSIEHNEAVGGLPDAALFFADRAVVIDHVEGRVYALWLEPVTTESETGPRAEIVTAPEAAAYSDQWAEKIFTTLGSVDSSTEGTANRSGATSAITPDAISKCLGAPTLQHPRPQYLSLIKDAQESILAGDTYEVCLTNQVSMNWRAAPSTSQLRRIAFAAHLNLRTLSPTPFGAFFTWHDAAMVSSSPERFLRVSPSGLMESQPIKGTRPRGATAFDDEVLRQDLATNEKDRSENLMIVDLVRNDLGRLSEPGEVHVAQEFQVETYATVHQLVSTVHAKMRAGFTAADAVKSAFPGGSMTGAPKIKTMEIIRNLEGRRRGLYSGGVGYFGVNGSADLSMVIRTLVFTSESVTLGVGGAIIAMSDPEAEFEETAVKARAALSALGLTWEYS